MLIGIIIGLVVVSFGFGMLTGVLYTIRKDKNRDKKTREYIDNRKKYEDEK